MTKNPPKATLGGVPLSNAGNVQWAETAGTAPPQWTFTVHKSRWERVKGLMGSSVELVIESDTARPLRVKGLVPIREVPSQDPHKRSFVVSDVRWWWQHEIVVRSMNITRKTGDRFMQEGVPVAIRQTFDRYQYAFASLDSEGGGAAVKWTPRRAVESVLGELAAKCGHGFKVESMPLEDDRYITVENVDLSENGNGALDRVLAHIPHAAVKITKDGTAVVFDATLRSAHEDVMAKAGGPTQAGSIDRVVSLDAIRPSMVNVYFAREVELRFDSVEESDAIASTSVVPGESDDADMFMENVLPLPDPTTSIPSRQGLVTGGTWVPIREAVAAWNEDLASLGKPKTPPPLTLANIRKYWFVLEALYTPMGKLVPNSAQSNWTARIATLRAHYRQTFQIPQTWMQHIRDLRPTRVGILDPISGARATSQAWSQYCIEPTAKMFTQAALQNDPDLQFYWINVDEYPGVDAELYDKTPSPAVVQVLDRDLGILKVDYREDPHGMQAQIHPSKMTGDDGAAKVPTRDLREQLKQVVAVDGTATSAAPIGLSDTFRVAVVVTAMPFSPNSEGRYLKYSVRPGDLALGVKDHFGADGGQARPWNVFVPPSLLTAWYAHVSTVSARESARLLFGISGADLNALSPVPGGPAGPQEALGAGEGFIPDSLDVDVDSLLAGYYVLNFEDLIPAMARAMATSVWAAFTNQREGTRAVHFNPDVEMVGSIEGITHTLAPDGRMVTAISMPQHRRPLNPLAALPSFARPKILGELPDGPA